MRVALVRPHEPVKSISSQVTQHPINLLSIAAGIMRQGVEVELWDYNVTDFTREDFLARLGSFEPDLIGFSCLTPLIKNAAAMAALAKEARPDVLTAAGGAHLSALPEEAMAEFPDFDLGIIGEGEETFGEVCAEFLAGRAPVSIPGTVYREDGEIRLAPPRPLIADLDSLPYPSRDLLDFSLYQGSSSPGLSNGARHTTQMFTSRGCPVECIFCASHVTHGARVRLRSASHVLGEAKLCVERHGIEHITIDDDTFTLGRNRVAEICRGLADLGLSWDCDSRVVEVSEEMLRIMADSGCKKIAYGVESGSPRILALLQKKIGIEQIEKAFRLTREAGILSSAFFMIGSHPSETEEDLEMSLALIRRIKPDFLLIYIAVPFPGTQLFTMMKEEGLIDGFDWDEFDIVRTRPRWRTHHHSPAQMVAHQKRFYRRFYFRPSVFFEQCFRLKSLEDFKYFFQSGRSFLNYVFLDGRG